jgi:hypothetical protein
MYFSNLYILLVILIDCAHGLDCGAMGLVFLIPDEPSSPYLPACYNHNHRMHVSVRSDSIVGHHTEGGAEKACDSLKQQ